MKRKVNLWRTKPKETIKEHVGYWREAQELATEFLKDINKKIIRGKTTSQIIKYLIQATGAFKVAIEDERKALGLPNTISTNSQQITKQEMSLSPELIQEIDRMYRLNSDI